MISAVITAHNGQATLPEALASIAAQTRPPDEVVVVDDGSTDATAAIAEASGARVIRQANRGMAAAMNTGMAAARFPLLAWLDDDDVWAVEKLARQAAVLADGPELAGVFGHVECFAAPTAAGRLQVPAGRRPGWLQGALLIRRASALAVGPLSEAAAAGAFIDWIDRARHQGLRFAMRPETVLHRRIRLGSMSNPSPARDAGYLVMARAALARRRAAGAT